MGLGTPGREGPRGVGFILVRERESRKEGTD